MTSSNNFPIVNVLHGDANQRVGHFYFGAAFKKLVPGHGRFATAIRGLPAVTQGSKCIRSVTSRQKTAADVAGLFNIHPSTVSRLLQRGKGF